MNENADNFPEISRFVKKVGTNPTVRDKTARFAAPVPSRFVVKQRRIFFLPIAPFGRVATSRNKKLKFAEREGFEPSRESPPYILSRDALSTTQPSLQSQKDSIDAYIFRISFY
tara:strand:- start:5786 stop:6127 length:342 start_codon:yes stop_codon:yes gene_type:complete